MISLRALLTSSICLVRNRITWFGVCEDTDILDVGLELKFFEKFVESFLDFCKIIFVLRNGEFRLKLFIAFIYGFATVFDLFSGFSHSLLYRL